MKPHFSPKAITFLKGLEKHNDRDWFNERKDVYEAEVKAPLLAVIAAVNDDLAGFAPEFVRDPAKCAMRIYRDIRFSKNKQPYKTNVAAWWARAGLEKTSGAGFYFQVSTAGVMIAAGAYMPEKDQLLAIRRMLLDRHAEVRAALKVKGMEPLDGMKMARGPKGFPVDGPATDLILQRQWGLSMTLPVEKALDAGLVAAIVKGFKGAAPLVALLNAPLVTESKKPLF